MNSPFFQWFGQKRVSCRTSYGHKSHSILPAAEMGFISSHQVVLENEVVCLAFKKNVTITVASDICC